LNLCLDQKVFLCVLIDQVAGGGACMALESVKKDSGGFEKCQLCYASMMGPVRKYQQGTLGCEEMCGVIKRRRLHAIGQLHLKRWFETTQAGKVVRSLLNKMAMA
jgi:hypothetical protein